MNIDARFESGVLRLAIRVEDANNALDLETIVALRSELAAARGRPELRLVVLESAVDRVFSLGMNLAALYATKDASVWATFEAIANFTELLIDLSSLPAPTVAVVDGVAAGGGVELAAICDTLIGTQNASFSIAQLRKGIFPFITSAVLVPRIGQSRFLHWALSGTSQPAKRLFDLGLVNQLCAPEDREKAVSVFVERVLSFDARTLRAGMTALRNEAASDLHGRIRRAHALFTLNCLAVREDGEP